MKKVAAISGHSRSFAEAFLRAGGVSAAAGFNSWLQAGAVANFDGFLLGLSP
jgi:hypothetical protein